LGKRGDVSNVGEPRRSSKGRLSVLPSTVHFDGVAPGTVYSMKLRIQNVSKQSCRVRINQPKTARFKVTFPKGAAVAPGLEVVADVEFVCSEDLVRTACGACPSAP
jgi:hypothetical protein